MTITPTDGSPAIARTTQSALLDRYQVNLAEVKKHVYDKIRDLGFVGIEFKNETIISKDSNVAIKLEFQGGNGRVYESTLLLQNTCGKDLNVFKLVDTLAQQAKTIGSDAIKAAIQKAKSITNLKMSLAGEQECKYNVMCLDEGEDEKKSEGVAVFVKVPKVNVILFSPQKIAWEIVKYVAQAFDCEDKLESDWKVSLTRS